VNKNQLIEGNALHAFNEECDNYHFSDPAGFEGVSSAKTQIQGDDSETIGNAVVEWLDGVTAQKKPFMATIWFHTPHQNFAATERWMNLYANTSHTETEKAYYADISGMDNQIGMIRQKLIDLGVYHDTALWFTADNGPEHKTPGSNGGLSGRKRDITEGGIRNPGLLEWPARITNTGSGSFKTEYAAKIVDYLPTIMDTLGFDQINAVREKTNPQWPLDGISLLPVIESIATGVVEGETSAFGAGRMSPLGWVSQHALGGKVPGPGHSSMQMAWMVGQLKLYANRTSSSANFTHYLFNISADPTESTNLIHDEQYRTQLASMTAGLGQWLEAVDHSQSVAETNCSSWDPKLPGDGARAAALRLV
jgi:arylsulfatase A-like enzyme